jgi:GntR family transcriptional repressor for pyruvate dehydrogenase complex
MAQVLDERDIIVLECIRDSGGPIGSWSLVEHLEEKNQSVSSASIGRILYRLEKYGYVEAVGNKGRVITKAGIKAIELVKTFNSIDSHKKELEKLINSKVLEDFIMVLQARKAIERETVRLAAENITDAKKKKLGSILEEQEIKAKKGESISGIDIDFHMEIARASHNTALQSLYGILSMMGQQSELFEFMRSQVTATYRQAHRSIMDAIFAHDADEAERCVIRHIDALIDDVTKYWDHFRE